MQRQSTQEWIRLSLRTPGILIFGMVFAPCGWILNLVATVAPTWRTLNGLPKLSADQYMEQGIFDICLASTIVTTPQCGQTDATYFGNQIITTAKGLMLASLIVTLIGLAVAIPGVRCWRDRPNWIVAGLGGLLIFLSGVMTIIPIAWYTHIYRNITSVSSLASVQVGYCIILGYIGGIFEILGGFVMFIGICRCCGGRNRGETRVEEVVSSRHRHPKPQPRRVDVPRVTQAPSSDSSSVAYSGDDDVSFPRAKSPAPRSVNPTYGRRPYDADL